MNPFEGIGNTFVQLFPVFTAGIVTSELAGVAGVAQDALYPFVRVGEHIRPVEGDGGNSIRTRVAKRDSSHI